MAALIQILGYDRDINPYDEGIVLSGAEAVLHGWLPYRDFWTMYGPGQFYLVAWLFSVFGVNDIVVRIIGITSKAAIASLSFVFIQRLGGKRYSWLGAFVTSSILLGLRQDAFPVFPALALSLAAILCAEKGLQSHAVSLLFAGVFTGISTCFRHDLGCYGAIAMAIALVATHIRARRRPIELLWLLGLYIAGIALITVPVAAYFLANVPLSDLAENLLVIPSTIYPKVRALPWPKPSVLLMDLGAAAHLSVYVPFMVGGSALLISIVASDNPSRDAKSALFESHSHWFLWQVLTLTCLIFTAKGMVRVEPVHMSQSIVIAISLLVSAWRFSGVMHGTAMHLIRLAVLISTALIVLPCAKGVLAATNGTMGLLADKGDWISKCLAPTLPRARCVNVNANYTAAAAYIMNRTTYDEPIYVGLNRHDRIFVNSVLFYFLAERLPATKWFELHPGVQTQERIQHAMIDDFERVQPRYIVLESQWENVFEPNASADSSGVRILDEYIGMHYEVAQISGSVRVMARLPRPR